MSDLATKVLRWLGFTRRFVSGSPVLSMEELEDVRALATSHAALTARVAGLEGDKARLDAMIELDMIRVPNLVQEWSREVVDGVETVTMIPGVFVNAATPRETIDNAIAVVRRQREQGHIRPASLGAFIRGTSANVE